MLQTILFQRFSSPALHFWPREAGRFGSLFLRPRARRAAVSGLVGLWLSGAGTSSAMAEHGPRQPDLPDGATRKGAREWAAAASTATDAGSAAATGGGGGGGAHTSAPGGRGACAADSNGDVAYSPFVATSLRQVNRLVGLATITPDDVVCDLGFGDAALLCGLVEAAGVSPWAGPAGEARTHAPSGDHHACMLHSFTPPLGYTCTHSLIVCHSRAGMWTHTHRHTHTHTHTHVHV
jgi:hypothetical protein